MEITGEQISTPPVEEEVVESLEEQAVPEEQEAAPENNLADEIKGLKAAVSEEREKRRILEAKADYLQQLAFQKGAQQEPPEPDLDPDDYPTNETVKKLLEKELSQYKQTMRDSQILQMEEAAKSKYNDFEDVVNTYTKELVNTNPDIYGIIMNSKNPAETAYAFGKTHPKFLEKIQKSTAQIIAKKIDKASNATPTLSALGGVSNDKIQNGYYSKIPKSEFDKIVADVMSKP